MTDGTDNHMMVWDIRPLGLTGSKVDKICDFLNITVNKNTVVGDKSAVYPGGIRIGTPAVTTRGYKEAEMEKIADFLEKSIKISLRI